MSTYENHIFTIFFCVADVDIRYVSCKHSMIFFFFILCWINYVFGP